MDQTVDDSVAGVETPLIESDNSIYTILIRLPPPSTAATESTGASSSNNSRRSRSASKSSRQAVSCSNNGSKLSSRSFEGNLSEVAASAGDCGRIQVRQLLTHLKSYLNTFGIFTLPETSKNTHIKEIKDFFMYFLLLFSDKSKLERRSRLHQLMQVTEKCSKTFT